VLNDHLRFADEFVRHKILDLVGDLHTLGRAIVGHVVGRNAGHMLNHELALAVQKLVASRRRAARPLSAAAARSPQLTGGNGLLPGVAAGG